MSECDHNNPDDCEPECFDGSIPLFVPKRGDTGASFLRFQAENLMRIAAGMLDEANRLDGIKTGV